MLYHLLSAWFEGRHYAYENALFRGSIAALFCFLLSLAFFPKFIRQLLKWRVGDRPEFDHASLNELTRDKSNVPTMGGLLMLVTISAGVLLLADLSNFYVRMSLVCIVWLGALGAVDDWLKLTAARRGESRDGLKMYQKLLFQVGLGVILGFFIFRYGQGNYAVMSPLVEQGTVPAFRVLSVPFYKPGLTLGASAFMIVTVLVMTGTSNAVNLTDGMDGLASGCVALASIVFMVLAYVVGTEELAARLLFLHVPHTDELVVLCGAIAGACLGFLWYNCHPAKVFMGDTGALPLGGLIGFVAVVTRLELMLFIVGGVFVIEAVSVMIQIGVYRTCGGRRVFKCAPIHHHFHLSGWSESQTVVRFWLLAIVFSAFALATIKLR